MKSNGGLYEIVVVVEFAEETFFHDFFFWAFLHSSTEFEFGLCMLKTKFSLSLKETREINFGNSQIAALTKILHKKLSCKYNIIEIPNLK